MHGKRVLSLVDLHNLAEGRRAVHCPAARCWAKPRPAAFIIHLPGIVIHRLILAGLYLYQKAGK